MQLAAPAKINLYLHLTGRRPRDAGAFAGYHEIDSLFAFLDLHDSLAAEPADGLSLFVSGPSAAALPQDDIDNLVLRAARLLAAQAGVPAAARLTLTKRIPVAAGLGGGSANAAAALLVLNRLWKLKIGRVELAGLALRLGADVPACLFGRPAFVGGIGETVRHSPALPPAALVLINPGVPLSTAQVFAAYREAFSAPGRFDESPESVADLARLLAKRGNDLTLAACRLVPEIAAALKALAAEPHCLLSRMSGSGATVFGLFETPAASAAAARALQEANPRWWIKAARLISDGAEAPLGDDT